MKKSIFKSLLSEEARLQMAEQDEYFRNRLIEFRNLSVENLITTAKYYLTQMEAPSKYNSNAPVYDAVFYHLIIPELFRRLDKHKI